MTWDVEMTGTSSTSTCCVVFKSERLSSRCRPLETPPQESICRYSQSTIIFRDEHATFYQDLSRIRWQPVTACVRPYCSPARAWEWPSCNVNTQSARATMRIGQRRSSGSAIHRRKWDHNGCTIVTSKALARAWGTRKPICSNTQTQQHFIAFMKLKYATIDASWHSWQHGTLWTSTHASDLKVLWHVQHKWFRFRVVDEKKRRIRNFTIFEMVFSGSSPYEKLCAEKCSIPYLLIL